MDRSLSEGHQLYPGAKIAIRFIGRQEQGESPAVGLAPDECDCEVYFWPGICISSDTSSEPPISRNGQDFALSSAVSIESASMIV